MASIRVVKNTNPITIRIGQRTFKKVVASEKAATQTLNTLEKLEELLLEEDVQDPFDSM